MAGETSFSILLKLPEQGRCLQLTAGGAAAGWVMQWALRCEAGECDQHRGLPGLPSPFCKFVRSC